MKTLFSSLFLFPLCMTAFSQEWGKIESNDLFSIYIAEVEHKSPSDGIHHQRFIFKYENHTPETIELHFNREVQYGDVVTTQEQDFQVTIPGNGSTEYDAAKQYDKVYYLFKRDNEGLIKRSLNDFKITNLRINQK